MVSNTTKYPPPPPSQTLSVYTNVLYFYFGKGGGVGEVKLKKVRGEIVHTNTNMTDYNFY